MITPYDDLIRQTAVTYRLPGDLLHAQVLHESSGLADAFRFEEGFYDRYIRLNTKAKAFRFGPLAACSYGLLQVMLETAMEDGFEGRPEDLFLPRVGLAWGAKHLRHLWDGMGGTDDTYRQALARYNGTGAQAALYADAIFQAAGRPTHA